MISVKYASIIAVAAFVSGSFVTSPELRAFAANTIGSTDIINNSIQSVDIKDGEVKTDDIAPSAIGSLRIKDNDVKAQDIATNAVGADEIANDAVGASELQGVHKLIFADCNVPAGTGQSGQGLQEKVYCPVAGVDPEDEVIVMDHQFDCWPIMHARIEDNSGRVAVTFGNICNFLASRAAGHISIIVYDELPDKIIIPPILP